MATGLVGTKQSVSTPNYEGGKDSRLNYLKDPVFGSPEYDIDEHYDTQPTDVPAEHLSPEYDPRGGIALEVLTSVHYLKQPENREQDEQLIFPEKTRLNYLTD